MNDFEKLTQRQTVRNMSGIIPRKINGLIFRILYYGYQDSCGSEHYAVDREVDQRIFDQKMKQPADCDISNH